MIIEEDRHSNVDLEIDIGQVNLGDNIVVTDPSYSPEVKPPAEEMPSPCAPAEFDPLTQAAKPAPVIEEKSVKQSE